MDTMDKKDCGHTGKWVGGGQSIFNTGLEIVVISTSVCGECGQSVININNFKLTSPKKQSDIIKDVPPMVSRFKKH